MASEAPGGLEQLFTGEVCECAGQILGPTVALAAGSLNLVANPKFGALANEPAVRLRLVERTAKPAVTANATEPLDWMQLQQLARVSSERLLHVGEGGIVDGEVAGLTAIDRA